MNVPVHLNVIISAYFGANIDTVEYNVRVWMYICTGPRCISANSSIAMHHSISQIWSAPVPS